MSKNDVDSPRQLITVGTIFSALGIVALVLFHDDLGATRTGRFIPMWLVVLVLLGIGVIGIGAGLAKRRRGR